MKIEGVLESDPDTVFNFLRISTKQGGKVLVETKYNVLTMSWRLYS